MSPERTGLRSLLKGLIAALGAAELDAFLKLGQGRVPDQIFVPLDPDAAGRVRHLQLLFLPGLDDPPVLQYYVGLPCPVAPGVEAELGRFLCALNVTLPVAGFGYHAPDSLLFFRHAHAVAVTPLDPAVVLWTVAIAEILVAQFGPLCAAVAAGLSGEEAEARLTGTLTEMVSTG